MTNEDLERAQEAHKFVDTMVPRADMPCPYPAWYGWALREAFEAGAKWQAGQLVSRNSPKN